MKKQFLSISLLLILANGAMARPKIIDMWRSGGFFNFYNRVDQTYFGVLNGADYYTLVCAGPGTNSCRLHYATLVDNSPKEQEIDKLSEQFLNEVITKADQSIDGGQKTGSIYQKYQSTLSTGQSVWITIDVKWQPDVERGGYKFTGQVTDKEAI